MTQDVVVAREEVVDVVRRIGDECRLKNITPETINVQLTPATPHSPNTDVLMR